MPEIEAFRPFNLQQTPSTTLYRTGTYRSDRAYVDAAGRRWIYAGMLDGDPMWRRDNENTAWVLNAVVDQFGPLTEDLGETDG